MVGFLCARGQCDIIDSLNHKDKAGDWLLEARSIVVQALKTHPHTIIIKEAPNSHNSKMAQAGQDSQQWRTITKKVVLLGATAVGKTSIFNRIQ